MLSIVEPATEEVLAEIPRAGTDEADAAVEQARRAFASWRAVEGAERAALLRALAEALDEKREELAALEARNAGKPIGDARGEIGRASCRERV